jgi:KEOPS complex subunit Pcc1
MQLVSGLVKNVVSKLLDQHMTSNFNAKIIVDAKEKTKSIFDSINTDNEFYPENPTKTRMSLNDKITILIESDHMPHLRANLNSTLRLIQASYDSIESVKI